MPSTRPTRRTVLGAGATLTAVLLGGCSSVLGETRSEESSSTHQVPSGARLAVENDNGSVTVRRGDGDALDLSVTKRTRAGRDHLDRVTVETRTEGDQFLVERVPVDGADDSRVTVDLTVGVPAGVPVARVTTANGAVSLTETEGETEVRTDNGAITVEDAPDVRSLVTSNGTIEATGTRGIRELRTSNGAIDADVLGLSGDATVETSNGRVRLALAPTLDARIDAATSNGAVTAEGLDLANLETGSTRLTGQLGDGTEQLRVRTSNGAIELTALEASAGSNGSDETNGSSGSSGSTTSNGS